MADAYRVRQYEPGDREEVLSLYGRVFDRHDESWFDWRYVDNPYVDAVPIAVAVHDANGREEVVGARPSLVLRFAVGDASPLGIVQVDPMVHPDHRRQGLFTRLVEHVYDHYAGREPVMSLGFPNTAVKEALLGVEERLSIDSGVVMPYVPSYRIQRPGPLAATGTDRRSLRAAGWLATPAARAYLAVRRLRADVHAAGNADQGGDADGGVIVERSEATPVSDLVTLAPRGRANGGGRVRATRDETFYDWRFANPRFDYETHVARRHGEPQAAVVVGRPRHQPRLAHLSEVLPFPGSLRSDAVGDGGSAARGDPATTTPTTTPGVAGDTGALLRALESAFDANRDAAAVVTAGGALPDALLDAGGFVPVSRPPLSFVIEPTTFIARPLTEGRVDGWRLGGVDLSSPDSWGLTMCEREIG